MKLNPLIYVITGILVLTVLFFLFKPKQEAQVSPTPPTATQESDIPFPAPESNTFELTIQGKKLISGPAAIKVSQGDEITIKITSNEAEQFHVHAYDNSVELEPGKLATLTFKASISGRFPFELENSKTEIGVLEVQPK